MGTVASLLASHVSFRCTSVDRLGVAGYIPGLQYPAGVIRFLLNRGYQIPSPAGLAHNHDRLVSELNTWLADHDVPVVRFARRQSKEEVARPYQAGAKAAGRPGVVLVGKAQERVSIWRGWKDQDHPATRHGHPHFEFTRQSALPDHWYFYLWDHEWGPAMVKLCPYAPYPVWVNANGHEWLKAQLDRAGVAYRELDNGLADVADPALAHRLAARLSAGHLRTALGRWMSWIPAPLLGADRKAGFSYDWSIRQIEVSDTACFDRPQNGRAWFEAAIRDHLDLGRPEKVSLVVNRPIRLRGPYRTPGRFQTQVITRDVDPQIQIHYKSDKVKAYFKEGRALRVETTINNPDDFSVGRRLTAEHWRQLRQVATATNARFLTALGEDQPPPPDAATLQSVVLPSIDEDGLRAPGLRFGDPRVMAVLAAMVCFSHVVGGLTNAGLRRLVAGLMNRPYTAKQATYDLRRLRRKAFIERVPGTHTYRVTTQGQALATFLTKVHARVLVPTLDELQRLPDPGSPAPPPLVTAWRTYEREVTAILRGAGLAA